MLVFGLVDIPLWVLLTVAVAVLLYFIGTRNHGHFKEIGIPGPKPWPFFGHFIHVLRGLMTFDLEMKRKYGKVHGTFLSSTPRITIFDEEILSEVLIKQFSNFPARWGRKLGDPVLDLMLINLEGEHWKHVRSTISPTFTTGKLRMMTAEINRCAKQLTDNITSCNEPFETTKFSGHYTLDVIASTAFGLRIDSQSNKENPFVKNINAIVNQRNFWKPTFFIALLATALCPKLLPYLSKIGIRFVDESALAFFVAIIKQTLDVRTEGELNRTDFIQLMANAQRGEKIYNDEDKHEVEDHGTSPAKTGLSHDEILANAFLFFLAGSETTSIGLTQLLYCLACNPDCQQKLLHEIDSILEDKEVDYDSIMKMTYLDQCLQESLRLYPPGPSINRVCKEDTVIKGTTFKKGTLATIPIYGLHHDPEVYPDPEKFDPDRFSTEGKAKRNPILWLPFNQGPRNCIAMRLALLEIKVAVVHILRDHRLVTCEKTEQPIQWKGSTWMKSKNGIWLASEKRK